MYLIVRGVGSVEGDSLETLRGTWVGAALGSYESRRVAALPQSRSEADEEKVWLAALLHFSYSCFGMVVSEKDVHKCLFPWQPETNR